jgi:RimJ/RimL family protein N-acetyltransferase
MRSTIETERLILRPLEFADAARIARFTSDPEVACMVGAIPLPHPRICVEGWILITKARKPLGADHVYGVELPGEGLIGCVGAHERKGGAIEVGYWFARSYWGHGYATEATRAIALAARELGPVGAGHFVDNPASGRVLEKAGFAYTGEIEQRFSIARGAKVDTRLMALRPDAIH